jgi:hypothetical protein
MMLAGWLLLPLLLLLLLLLTSDQPLSDEA